MNFRIYLGAVLLATFCASLANPTMDTPFRHGDGSWVLQVFTVVWVAGGAILFGTGLVDYNRRSSEE